MLLFHFNIGFPLIIILSPGNWDTSDRALVIIPSSYIIIPLPTINASEESLPTSV